ncbi:hypothetical protein BD770DRAFT_379667 [Pilaira anomala]|nr:hypothetical protein BD770DRAFT_379667 [Pilaira anomala]
MKNKNYPTRDAQGYVNRIKCLQEEKEESRTTNQEMKESVKRLQSQRQALSKETNEIKEF